MKWHRFGSMPKEYAAAATVEASASVEQIRIDINFDYTAEPLSPVLFPVPERLNASVVVLIDGPELPAQSW